MTLRGSEYICNLHVPATELDTTKNLQERSLRDDETFTGNRRVTHSLTIASRLRDKIRFKPFFCMQWHARKLYKKYLRMHHNAPVPDIKFKNYLRRGHSPSPYPTLVGRGLSSPDSNPSVPMAPQPSRFQRSTQKIVHPMINYWVCHWADLPQWNILETPKSINKIQQTSPPYTPWETEQRTV